MTGAIVFVAALYMVVLHRVDGGEVVITTSHVTSLQSKSPGSAKNKLFTPEARCIVWLDDGKLIAVVEPCDIVKALMNEAARK